MIAFATLFLGLVVGVQSVDLVVAAEVAAVEVRLDGRKVATLTEEPWTVRCDFGPTLVPQVLEAVAFDAGGEELGRARQWINLPRRAAALTLALGGSRDGTRIARLTWESLVGAEPQQVVMELDGRPLAFEDPQHVVLPPHDERQLHFLRAEVEFTDHLTETVEVTFGGTYAHEVSAELTAFPVASKRRKLRRKDAALVAKGEPLTVVAVEKGSARVILVPDRTSRQTLNALSEESFAPTVTLPVRAKELWDWARLRHKQYVRFLWPVARRREGVRNPYDVFPNSQDYSQEDGGLFYLLYHAGANPLKGRQQRLADAVAAAGLYAAEHRSRRAVVLLLGGPPETPLTQAPRDSSQLTTPADARRYLEHLRVPLAVWSLAGETEDSEWGEVRDVSSLAKLRRAADELAKSLDRQWIVWLDGVHLPQDVALAPEAAGLRMVE